jgi:hypothetical protein
VVSLGSFPLLRCGLSTSCELLAECGDLGEGATGTGDVRDGGEDENEGVLEGKTNS